jgi:hypothetical protein
MQPRQQLVLMDKVIRQLDDIKKSQTSVLKKISQVEADNINLGLELLNDSLPALHEEVDNCLTKVSTLIEQFTENRNEFLKNNPGADSEAPA